MHSRDGTMELGSVEMETDRQTDTRNKMCFVRNSANAFWGSLDGARPDCIQIFEVDDGTV